MKKILGLLCITSSMFSMQLDIVPSENRVNRFQEKLLQHIDDTSKVRIAPSSVFVPHQLGSVELYYGKKGFSVRQDDKKYQIKTYFTDPMIRNVNKKQLKAFLKAGYLSLNQMDDGEFSLKAKGRLNGGGPLLGLAAYWVTKSLCYGVMAAAIGGAMAGVKATVSPNISSGSAYPPTINERALGALTEMASTGAQMGLAGAGAIATVPLTTGGVTSGTTVSLASLIASGTVSSTSVITTSPVIISTAATGLGTGGGMLLTQAAINGAGLTNEAMLVTGAGMATSAGTTLGVTGSIELLSLKVGLFFGMTPTP